MKRSLWFLWHRDLTVIHALIGARVDWSRGNLSLAWPSLLCAPQSKRIAGRIIPAIATTTAAVAGLMCLELYKLVQRHRKIASYRTAYFVLGTQNFVWCKPRRAPRFQVSRASSLTPPTGQIVRWRDGVWSSAEWVPSEWNHRQVSASRSWIDAQYISNLGLAARVRHKHACVCLPVCRY